MDSITQAVLGAGVAEVTVGKKIGNKSILIGAVLGTIPDLDTLFTSTMEISRGLLAHRGLSHSVFFCVLIMLPIAMLLNRFFRKHKIGLKKWSAVVALVLFTHVLLDCFTTYGTGIMEPFSNIRIEWSTIAIVDVFYTIPFLVLLLVTMFFKRGTKLRSKLGYLAIIISSFYLLLTPINKININRTFKSQLVEQNIEFNRFKAFPAPLTNFLWMGVAETDSNYYTGYYSVFDESKKIKFFVSDKNHEWVDPEDKIISNLIRFSKQWYIIKNDNNILTFNDLRFGRMGMTNESPYIFSYIIQNDHHEITITENRIFPEEKNLFKNYVRRIFGNVE